MDVDAKTGKATPRNTTHTVVKGGDYLKELDSAGNFVKEVKANSRAAKTFASDVEKTNKYTSMDQTRNANQYNATGGGTAPSKLSEDQKKTLITLSRAKKV
jgi:hypothetical protein